MEKIIITIAAVILAMGGMAVGSAVNSNSIVEDGIEYYMQADKAVYSLGENVQMLYRVTNLSEDEVEFIFTYGPLDNTCDWMVDKDELRIWDNLGRPGTAVMTSFNLSPSTSYEYTHTWNMTYKNGDDILPGNYNVTGVLGYHPDHERYVPVSVQIEIIPEPAMIYYVDDDASGASDGSSWADAYNYLQDALAAASSGDEIWVAEGVYKPDQGAGVTPGDREATFQLINGVAIKGGYAGFGETDPNDRDVDVYKTVLSGDLAGDDGPDFANNSENSWHVVRGSGTTTAILDGFTVTGGNANGSSSYYYSGGGMYNQSGRVTILNCTFIGNWARDFGGGMYNNHSTPMLTNCTFTCNMAREGGGMFNSNMSSPVLTNCTFIENIVVKDEGSFGGGIYNDNSSPILTNCTFTRNVAGVLIPDHGGGEGGGMYNRESSPTLTNCTFSGNTALCGGGGMGNRRSSPTLNNCIFTGNLAIGKEGRWGDGGAIFNASSTPLIKSCTFSGNSAVSGGAIYITGEFQGTLTDCLFENNAAIRYGGAISYIGSGELNIIRCDFCDGSAERGGAIYSYASLVLSQCILVNNQAEYAGAINTDGDITLTNCLLANNQALVWGGALSNMMNTSRSVNCTFVGNSANYGGAIFSNIECDTIAINSIFWNNTAQTGSQIATSGSHGGSTLTVNYCDIENYLDGLYMPSGCTLNWGEDNINAEPLFADSDNGDYRLSASSPCIDAGDPNYIAEPNEMDLDGKPRVIGGRIDMGAFEYSPPIPAEVRIVPRSINLASRGNWITCYIWLGEDYDVADIDANSVFLEGEIEAESFFAGDGRSDTGEDNYSGSRCRLRL